MSQDYLGKGRVRFVAIILLTVISLTLCMLFWENINLMKTTSTRIGEEEARILSLQSEINGRPMKTINKHQIKTQSNVNIHSTNNNLQTSSKLEQNYYNIDPIYNNPLNNKQCQNALINKENINKKQLLQLHVNKIECAKPKRKTGMDRNINNKWIPYIWTREFISALSSDTCFEPKTPVRTAKDFFILNDNNIPVFYHIPKCASSSTAAMTGELFNFSIHWRAGPDKMHEPIHTKCGFAFIRDPIQRFISAYYTINKKIYREMKHEFISGADRIPERFINKLNFLTIMEEPKRFETFMNDLFKQPHFWGVNDPLKHISSQIYFLSNWYTSDINFFGRVEHYPKHWKILMNYNGCEWFQKYDINVNISHALFHYGTMGISLYNSMNTRQKEYVDGLNMRDMLEKMYGKDKNKYNISENDVLPPAYYFITESMYNKIVEFYYQDFVCFGYKPDYNEFKKYVKSKKK
eukprot:413617_1